MIGFIKKDLLMIKSNIKTLCIIMFVYIFLAYQGQMDFSFILPFMSVIIMISTFAYDSYNKWDAYACCLPNGKQNSVKAKYIATLLLIIMTTIIMMIITIVISYVYQNKIDINAVLESIVVTLGSTIFLQSIMYPPIYKFGVEKARIGIFVIVFGIAIIGSFLYKYIDFKSISSSLAFLNDYGIIIIPIILVITLYISYKISETIYLKKEY